MKHAKNVDEYIASCPKEFQEKLQEIRKIIKETAPTAIEKISYGMPFYEYKWRLVYFALMKDYIGLYIPPPIIENNKNELKNYKTTVSAVHFPLNEPFPTALIKKMVRERMKINEEKK